MISFEGPRTRRDVLLTSVAGALALAIAPRLSFAEESPAAAEIEKIVQGRKLNEGKILLDMPSIAENGQVVPLNFSVESPMTEAAYVKAVHFFAEGNPVPTVATYYFTPLSPSASAQIRIRLAKTQKVIAVAEMSNGELYTAAKEVKVTIGGCGG